MPISRPRRLAPLLERTTSVALSLPLAQAAACTATAAGRRSRSLANAIGFASISTPHHPAQVSKKRVLLLVRPSFPPSSTKMPPVSTPSDAARDHTNASCRCSDWLHGRRPTVARERVQLRHTRHRSPCSFHRSPCGHVPLANEGASAQRPGDAQTVRLTSAMTVRA